MVHAPGLHNFQHKIIPESWKISWFIAPSPGPWVFQYINNSKFLGKRKICTKAPEFKLNYEPVPAFLHIGPCTPSKLHLQPYLSTRNSPDV
jgi:hypothetical protein